MGGTSIFAIMTSIFTAGLVLGGLTAIGLSTGSPTDESGLAILLLKEFCKAVPDQSNGALYDCGSFVIWMIFLSFVGTIYSIIASITQIESLLLGIFIYGSGYVFGFLTVLAVFA